MTRFTITHRKNQKHPHLRPVDETYREERAVEAILDEMVKTSEWLVDGRGPFSYDDAISEKVLLETIYGRTDVRIELVRAARV